MTKIDDEMVERGAEVLSENLFFDGGRPFAKTLARTILEAALSPKPEPEIEVSYMMQSAGADAGESFRAKGDSSVPDTIEHLTRSGWFALCSRIYRAMESTRLKEAATRGVNAAAPEKPWTLPIRPEFHTGVKSVRDHHPREAGITTEEMRNLVDRQTDTTFPGLRVKARMVFDEGTAHSRKNDVCSLHYHRRAGDPK